MAVGGDWLKLYRSILDSSVFADDWHCRLFIWCLCKANYSGSKFRGQVLKRGEFITGRISGSDELRVSPSKFYRGLHALEELGCIVVIANSNWTTVSVCNYERYQYSSGDERTASEQPADSQRTADEQQMNTEKELQEGKKERREEVGAAILPAILDTEEFRQRLNEWLAYKAERRQSYKPQGLKAMIGAAENRAAAFGIRAVMDAMQTAMANGWQGWDQASSFTPKTKSPSDPRGTFAAAASYLAKRNQGGKTDGV